MASYERVTRVDAPFEDVWAFHSRIEGLEALTPSWMNLRIETVIGPDGEVDPDVLEEGAEVAMSMRPFGVGPRKHWTSLITERGREGASAYFRDEMLYGPFDRWVHTHAFYADDGGTLVRDRVEYALPLGGLGDALEPFSQVGFEGMFRDRHRRTKVELE